MIAIASNEYLLNNVAQCLEMKIGQPHLARQAVLIGVWPYTDTICCRQDFPAG
jgi:hypothetical protein